MSETATATAVFDQEPLSIPPGYGMRVLSPNQRLSALAQDDLEGLFDALLVFEPPRRGKQYVIGVDVAQGGGKDRSCVDVCRVGDLQDGEEQVAQFITSSMEPIDLAYVIEPIGRFYRSTVTHLPAMVAIELNGFGLGVQAEMDRHIGYENFFIWQHEDRYKHENKFTRSYGWWTGPRTRPLILQRYFRNLRAIDPTTGYADYRINSPHTLRELMDFKTAGALWEGEGDPYDDCVMSGAISVHVAQTLQFEQREPLADTRRRLHEEKARAERAGIILKHKISAQNTDISVEEMDADAGADFIDMLDNSHRNHYL